MVGAGPNGLSAAIALARAGRPVAVLEGAETAGGGCRSAELTLPGFVHDTCATVHALALASPFLRTLPLAAHGFVLGGGIGLVGSCDVILASDDATFGLPEIDRGALGAASHLLRMFPIQKVRRMLYSGEPIGAAEAYRLGALEQVVPRQELMPTARALAAKIAAKSPRAVRLAKESLNGIEPLDVKKSYRFEQGFTLELYTSPDSQEARSAFVEKRDAKFTDKGKK